jgi:hypothetical protein
MDLYGSGASIAQANAQTEAARQINEATRDFNNSLAEQLDESNLEQDEDRSSKLQKNILSGVTSGGKLVSKRAAIKEGAKLGFKEVKTSLAERMAREAGEERAPLVGGARGGEQFGARQALRAAEERTGTAGVFAGEDVFAAAQEEAARFGGEVTDIGESATLGLGSGVETAATAIGGDPRFGLDDTVETAFERRAGAPTELYTAEQQGAEAAASDVAGGVKTGAEARTALKEGAEETSKFLGKAAKFGKVGVAGLGGGIDAYQDVGRLLSGEKGLDVFGSNTASRVGNIGNIVGSALEVAGVATGGITPWSIALETAGAGISLISSVAEAGGELEAGEESKETAQKDITSQVRGETTAQEVEQAVGRTQ